MHIETDGLVIKEQNVGESDRLITVLTSKYGVIRAFVRGSKSVKSKLLAGTQLLSYSDFVFYKGKDAYSIDSASAKNVFFELRSDIDNLSIAFYLAELAFELAPEDSNSEELLHLILNSLYLLARKRVPAALIKSAAELRAMALSGFMPDLIACSECGTFETPHMYFSLQQGSLLCEDCGSLVNGELIGISAVTAMRHIVYSEPKKVFDFTLKDTSQKELSLVTENFVLTQTGKHFNTLDFYKTISNTSGEMYERNE